MVKMAWVEKFLVRPTSFFLGSCILINLLFVLLEIEFQEEENILRSMIYCIYNFLH